MRHIATIGVANNYIVIKDYPAEMLGKVLLRYCRKHLFEFAVRPIPGTQKKETYVHHIYGRLNNDRTELRISSSLLDDFKEYLRMCGYNPARLKIENIKEIEGKPVEFKWKEGWGELYPKQQPWGDYQLDEGYIKINNLPPGDGKTIVATHTMVNTKKRTLITTLPRYVTVWLTSFKESLDLDPGDLYVSGEGDSIDAIHSKVMSGEIDPKIIIVPLTRYVSYLKREREEDLPPLDQIFTDLEIGLRIMDESHESIHQVYMSMMFGNFTKTIVLSATLTSDTPMTNRIYSYLFPKKMRFKDPEPKKYIKVVAYHHRLNVMKYRIRSQGFGGYSHLEFEKSIMRNPKVFGFYYSLLKDCYQTFYKDEWLTGQKCLIFAATKAMCRKLAAELKRDYPDDDIFVFTGDESKGDPFAYIKHMVVITTPKSCGTGKDIKKLRTVISPYAVSSQQLNEQMKGRLRDIEKWWPGVPPVYAYFVCDDIQKQLDYHRKRREVFDKSAIEYINWMSDKYLL